MLGHAYRYQAHNGTGTTVTVTVKSRRYKFGSDGSRTDAAEATPISAASIGAAAYSNSSTIDNSTDKFLGAHLLVTMAPSGLASGAVTIFLQHSTDGGTTWPDDGQGIAVGRHYFVSSSASVARNYEV